MNTNTALAPLVPEVVTPDHSLITSHRQFTRRPPDKRYATLSDASAASRALWDRSVEKEVDFRSLRVEVVNNDVMLAGRGGVPATLTNWAFRQLCTRAKAPADYIGSLPATLATQNLNHGLAQYKDDAKANLFVYRNKSEILGDSSFAIRAINGEHYTRLPNYQLIELAEELQDRYGLSVAKGKSERHKPGLALSNHDIHLTLLSENHTIDTGLGSSMHRAFILRNGELGEIGISYSSFYYDSRCTNGNFFGVTAKSTLSFRHTGDMTRVFNKIRNLMVADLNRSTIEDQTQMVAAQGRMLGESKEEVVQSIYRMRVAELTLARLNAAYDLAEQREDQYGNPRSVWAMFNSLTELSQGSAYRDQQLAVEKAAGRLMALAE